MNSQWILPVGVNPHRWVAVFLREGGYLDSLVWPHLSKRQVGVLLSLENFGGSIALAAHHRLCQFSPLLVFPALHTGWAQSEAGYPSGLPGNNFISVYNYGYRFTNCRVCISRQGTEYQGINQLTCNSLDCYTQKSTYFSLLAYHCHSVYEWDWIEKIAQVDKCSEWVMGEKSNKK